MWSCRNNTARTWVLYSKVLYGCVLYADHLGGLTAQLFHRLVSWVVHGRLGRWLGSRQMVTTFGKKRFFPPIRE